jgi:hypothetical protein
MNDTSILTTGKRSISLQAIYGVVNLKLNDNGSYIPLSPR